MTIDEIKKKLNKAFFLKNEIRSISNKILSLRDSSENNMGLVIDDMPKAQGYKNDKICTLVTEIIDLEREYTEKLQSLVETEREIKNLIYSLRDDRQRIIMIERYVNLNSWEQVAVNTNYTYKHVHRLHGEALQTLHRLPNRKKIKNDTK